ncbi:hypothetical protein ISF_07760 [Cordyceps fumosorosea ARSEF 2679]|uniref:Nuclear pore protein n=1 Tax=Cordyceps fumosorosea (strain ARSEF 2679) TaxID=1081104 RepID=A0A162IDM2_CORFA|nr:hypothetical protein ISF_07760 [Cordyceps fumosorosea ARSEF 2679]OAA55655.1 hypothetical protein ISF_07760 [Cordyceps fumosorosea ARSEF 2679]
MPGNEVIFDGDGDARLHVGAGRSANPAVFTVCSRALSRASPVFDNIFHGDGDAPQRDCCPSSEGPALSDRLVVELPHDDPAALALLLYAVHARFDQVPARLPTDALHALAAVAHKYGATAVLRPWTASWTRPLAAEPDDGGGAALVKAMGICWVLGCREGFFHAAAAFVERAPAPALDDLQIPPDTIEYILSVRLETIRLLCGVLREMIRNLIVVDEAPRWCRHATWFGHHRCESMILGSLVSGLSRAGLWPLPEAEEVKGSVRDLRARLDGVEVQDIGRAGGEEEGGDHGECNPSQHLRDATREVMEDVPRRLESIMFKTGQLDLSK